MRLNAPKSSGTSRTQLSYRLHNNLHSKHFFSILIWFVKNEKEDIVLDWKNDILRKLVI